MIDARLVMRRIMCGQVLVEDRGNDIEFGSELRLGTKGMLVGPDRWVTWEIDEKGNPHHDDIMENYFIRNRYAAYLTATHWWDGSLNIQSGFELADPLTQVPVDAFRGGRGRESKIYVEHADGEWHGSFMDYADVLAGKEVAVTEALVGTGIGWITGGGDWIPSTGLTTHSRIAADYFGTDDEEEAYDEAIESGWIRVSDGLFQLGQLEDREKRRIGDHLKKQKMWDGTVGLEVAEPYFWGRVKVSELRDRGLSAGRLLWRYR